MKLIKIQFSGLENFSSDINIDFYAEDKVVGNENVNLIHKSLYSQNVLSFVGINATGKTTVLRLIDMAINIVINNYGLDQISNETKCLFKDDSKMQVLFFLDDKFYLLESVFVKKNDDLVFKSEQLSIFNAKEILYKKQLKQLSAKSDSIKRDDFVFEINGGVSFAIKDTDSIISSVTAKVVIPYISLLKTTNKNMLSINEEVDPCILKLFDRGIESVCIKDDDVFVKFHWNEKSETVKIDDADLLLSSGTIKGNKLFNQIKNVIQKGGYLIVDEIENHMNKKYVQLVLDVFQDHEINKKGATLLFSTHYIEIIDNINRKDAIYVTKKDKNQKCDIIKYSDVIKRNDIKKAEILLSNTIEGTAPYYEDIQEFRKMLCEN